MVSTQVSGTVSKQQTKVYSFGHTGLSGPESRLDIRRHTFGDFLKRPCRVVIPIFQRRYCWDANRVDVWFDDVLKGKRDHLGLHNSGNVVVKKINSSFPPDVTSLDEPTPTSTVSHNNGASLSSPKATSTTVTSPISTPAVYICIDGQQRLTTTLLLCASIRDAILKVSTNAGFSDDEKQKKDEGELDSFWAMVVVKWSACSPLLTIQVRISLKSTVLFVQSV